jgi:hypothetical protein
MSALMPLTTCIEHLARHFEKMDVDDRKDSIMFLDRLTRDPLSYPKVIGPIVILANWPIKAPQVSETAQIYQFARPARTRRKAANKPTEVTA